MTIVMLITDITMIIMTVSMTMIMTIIANIPFVQGAAHIDEEERRARASSGQECDIQLKNAIEGIIIKWAYQVGNCKYSA